jgi:hypothetical protein
MNERDWDKFFELLERVVNLGEMPWGEKRDQVKAEAAARGAETALEEFSGWFEGE